MEGRVSGPGSAGGIGAASEGDGWEAERSSGVAAGPKLVGAGTVVLGMIGRLGRRGFSWKCDSEEVGEGMGPGPAHGPQGLSKEGLAPVGTSESVAPGSTGKVSGTGVTVDAGAVGGKRVGISLAGGARERSGL